MAGRFKLPYFKCFASDVLGSTKIALMQPDQIGAYWLLLCHAWGEDDCSLPDDDESLAALSRLAGNWPQRKAAILRCFVPHPDRVGRIINPRLHKLWLDEIAFREERREAGKKGADSRWADEIEPPPEVNDDGTAYGSAIAQPMAQPMAEGMAKAWPPQSTSTVHSPRPTPRPVKRLAIKGKEFF